MNTAVRAVTCKIFTHGYGGYSHGCSCEICLKAKRDYIAARRSIARQAADVAGAEAWTGRHGTRFAYEERGCRCEACAATQLERHRRDYAIRRCLTCVYRLVSL